MTQDEFAAAQARVKTLTARPPNDRLLSLYALFKQGSMGDVQGKRPGMMDFKGRAKYDAWATKRGVSQEDARAAYVSLVDQLVNAD